MGVGDKGVLRGVLIETILGEDFVFDATTVSTHTLQAEITSNPIETSSGTITDHRRTKPATWSFTAILVDEPNPQAASDRGAASTVTIEGDPLRDAITNGPQISRRALDSLFFLQRIFSSSRTVDVTTDTQKMESVVLENLTWRVLASMPLPNGFTPEPSVIEVSGSFREIRFASTEEVAVPKDAVKEQQGEILIYGPTMEQAGFKLQDKTETILHRVTGGLSGGAPNPAP